MFPSTPEEVHDIQLWLARRDKMQSNYNNVGNNPDPTLEPMQACSSCRKSKKACDKVIPVCSTCVRLRRRCVYEPIPNTQAILDLYESLQKRVVDLQNKVDDHQRAALDRDESTINAASLELSTLSTGDGHSMLSSSPFSTPPSIFFLDANIFQRRDVRDFKPFIPIPGLLLEALGNEVEIRTTIGSYFFSLHPWMGFISQQTLYRDLEGPLHALDLDVALLILCMKLINLRLPKRPADPRTALYFMSKKYFAIVESGEIYSMRLLQSAILIALYEVSHAIYPAAYMSVGQCARLCQAIGLQDSAGVPQVLKEPESWEEMEERRRIWWAIFVLDRNINLGNPSLSLALDNAQHSDHLPVNDSLWDRGEIASSELILVSSSTSIPAARFARLCQSSHLLGLVLRHINDHVTNIGFRLEEATQLHHAISSLISHLLKEVANEPTKICASLAIAYSALITLSEYCIMVDLQDSPSTTAAQDLQELGITGFDSLIPNIVDYATHIKTVIPYNIDRAPPLIAHCLYRAAVRLSSLVEESTDGASMRAYTLIKESLRQLDTRWRISGEYLRILEE